MWLHRVGDEVVIDISEESRGWGFSPFPNGTKAKILEFGEIDYGRTRNFGKEPGIYENTSWAYLEVCGKRYPEALNCCHFKLPAKILNERRAQKDFYEGKKLRDLPDMKFWEEDRVKLNGSSHRTSDCAWHGEVLRVVNVHYLREWCHYDAEIARGGTLGLHEKELELVERGNVWRYYHNEPMEFSSLVEEADLMLRMGFVQETRNPRTGFYGWSLDEVLSSIAAGDVDGFTAGGCITFFSNDPRGSITAYKYNDRALGKRVAQATLKGFGRR